MMSRRVRPDPVLLDTGPLLTYLALLYSDAINASRKTEQERFGKLIEMRHALTTPHVILEATKLREHSQLARAGSFLKFSLEALTSGAISERWCSLEEICKEPGYTDFAGRFGVADATLLFLSAREPCLLLTDEDRLFAAYEAGSKFEISRLDQYLRSAD